MVPYARRIQDDDAKIKYDILSVFFIGFVLFFSVLFYIATFSLHLLGGREDVNNILGIRLQDAYVESSAELDGANELVVMGSHMTIKAIQAQGESIRVEYSISAQTNDVEYATSILEKILQIEPGERAYLLTNASIIYNNRKIGYPVIDCVVYLPPGKTLDLSQFYGSLQVDAMLKGQVIRP